MVSKSRLRQIKLEAFTQIARAMRDAISDKVKPSVFGRLKKSFRFIVTEKGVTLFSLYYWARFVNDGRGAVYAETGRKLLFFIDPRDDPRIAGDYPRRPGEGRSIPKAEFRSLLRRGLAVLRDSVGPTTGQRFLERGIPVARKAIPAELRKMVRGETRRLIRRGRNKITVRF